MIAKKITVGSLLCAALSLSVIGQSAARPYYGTIVDGVALGSLIVASSIGVAPVAPAPNMCWFRMDETQIGGYWDYCRAPY
jgi:hypothetical protein